MGYEFAGFIDREDTSCPPGIVFMSHDERAEDVRAFHDLIRHDAAFGLKFVVAAAELVDRGDRFITRHINIMDGRAVNGLSAPPDREFFGNAECFSVANHHADDLVIRDPGTDPGVHTHL